MVLDHERLDVYLVALDFVVFANEVIERLPRGRSHLADQLTRASTSIVLNLAEGAGKLSKPDKRRYYLTARGRRPSPRHCSTFAYASSSSERPSTVPARSESCASSRCSSSSR
jgi:four helix bundle protein